MKIGIITAMNVEAKDYIQHFNLELIKEVFGMNIYKGKYEDYDLSLMVCGCGKVNATYAMKFLIDECHPESVLHSGIAGGIACSIEPLDLVLATTLTYHDIDKTQMIESPPFLKEFKCDEHLSTTVLDYAINNKIKIQNGRIISGDSFISNSRKATELASEFCAMMVDMESAAIVQVCNMENIPVAVLRCASDNAGDEAIGLLEKNERAASTQAAGVFIGVLKNKLI